MSDFDWFLIVAGLVGIAGCAWLEFGQSRYLKRARRELDEADRRFAAWVAKHRGPPHG